MSFNYRFEPPTINELNAKDIYCPYDSYCEGEFDCEPCRHNRGENMHEYERKALFLDVSIQNEFGSLDWADQTLDQDDELNYTGHYHISFTGPCIDTEAGETCRSAGFRGREDGFFSKMHRIKNMIKNCGMTAELIKFYADKDCPYSEATININLDGGEL